MPALPAATDFTGSAVTEGQFKTAMTNQRGFLAGLLGTTGNADAALAALGALGGQSVAKTAAYTVLAADRGKVFECSGTFSLTLTAAATLGAGFSFIVANTGAGIITIDPNASELINGGATVNIAAGAWAVISCNGTSFRSMSAGTVPSGTLIGFQVFTASGTYSKSTNNPSFVVVEVQAGGGKGGNGATVGTTGAGGGGGGGGGGYSCEKILASALAAGETVTVGGTGAASSFGAFLSATAGVAGSNSSGSLSSGASGGAGGIGSGGNINIAGSGGGSSASGDSRQGGNGGASRLGGGAPGNSGGVGVTGGVFGGGCSGGVGGSSTGGNGGAGVVIVWEYA